MVRPTDRRPLSTLMRVLGLAAASLLSSPASPAQEPATPPAAETPSIPKPEDVLGAQVGADFYLASYADALGYFQALAAASPRIQLLDVGTTTFGRKWTIALISTAANLRELDRWRQISLRLAHPEGLSDEEARALAREGRAIVHIDGALHSTESATSQFPLQLAYDLVAGEGDPAIDGILSEVVLMLWFSINPDGQDMMVDWYRSNLGTPFEVAPMVALYQAYIGHDNNRDGYMLNMIESRVVTSVLRRWEPQILYNHHQTAPFPARIWIPPFAEPVSTHVHPLMWRTINLIGMRMAHALEERGQVGAMHMGVFDDWYPGFIDHANNFHNVVSFLTETGLYRYATPHFYTVQDFPRRNRDLRPESLYASPWKGGWWRIGDAVDYMVTASMAVLDIAAKYRESLLYNRYQAGRDVIRSFQVDPPYAYFIPREQRDPLAPVELLRRLAFNGIEIHELTADAVHEGRTYPAGTWVIAMDQPFALFVRQLFAVQEYPDLRQSPDGPPDNPYDVAGWTLPYQMDVRVVEAGQPLSDEVRAAMRPVQAAQMPADGARFDSAPGLGFDAHSVAAALAPAPGKVTGNGSALLVDPRENNAFRAVNAAWRAGGSVLFVPDGEEGPAYAIKGLEASVQDGWVVEWALQGRRAALATNEENPITAVAFERPRIGLYRPWTASIDEGWTRWVLERYGFDIVSIRDSDVRAGALRERLDVLILADMGADEIIEGYAIGTVPARYAGGIGKEGVRAVDRFVRDGGTLVCLNSSSEFAIAELHLPVRNVVAELDRDEFFAAGSIHALQVDTAHPVMAGMPAEAKIIVDQSPVFTTSEGFEGSALVKYPEQGSPLLSGYLLGEKHLQGFAAALDVHHGEGRVLLLGFRPQWRGQPFGNFRILFNAALFHGELARSTTPTADFWTAPPEKEKEKKDEEGGNGEGNGRRRMPGGR